MQEKFTTPYEEKSYLLSRQRDGSNIGYLRAKIVIVGSNKRVKM